MASTFNSIREETHEVVKESVKTDQKPGEMPADPACLNVHVEKAMNDQINLELSVAVFYRSLAHNFAQENIRLLGFVAFFEHSAQQQERHAAKLIKYLKTRGGRLQLKDLQQPDEGNVAWHNSLESVKFYLVVEKRVNQAMLVLRELAEECGDANLVAFLKSEYLNELMLDLEKISSLMQQLEEQSADNSQPKSF